MRLDCSTFSLIWSGNVNNVTKEIIKVSIKLLKNKERKLPSNLLPKSVSVVFEITKFWIKELKVITATNIIRPAKICEICWLEFSQPLTYTPIENEYLKLRKIETKKDIR